MQIESEGIIERIKQMMDSMEMNATTFATEAGITPSVISHLLNGRNRPTIETLNNIIAAYPEWSFEWLLFGKGSPKCSEAHTDVSMPTSTPSLFGQQTPMHPLSASPHQGTAELPFSPQEISQIRRLLSDSVHKEESRAVEEIRIYYTDGSYEVFSEKRR